MNVLPPICSKSRSLDELRRQVFMALTGKLAAKCNKYLPVWRSTCRKLHATGHVHELKKQSRKPEEEDRELGKLLLEVITEEIVVAVPHE